MAYFARLDEKNVVIDVVGVDNSRIDNADGLGGEAKGAEFLKNLIGGRWVQTSYSASFRKNYAGIGYTYDKQKDAFIPPKPFESWILDEKTWQWKAPVDMPTDLPEYPWWDEDGQQWRTGTN